MTTTSTAPGQDSTPENPSPAATGTGAQQTTTLRILAWRGPVSYKNRFSFAPRFYRFRWPGTFGDHVVGMALPGEPVLDSRLFPPPRSWVQVTMQFLTLPTSQAERVHAFFDEFYVREPQVPREWNCHMFMRRVLGIDTLPFGALTLPPRYDTAVKSKALECGVPYGIRRADGTAIHSMLGLGEGNRTLSVGGLNSSLVIAKGMGLHRIYYGRGGLYRVLPETFDDSASSRPRR